MEVCSNAISKFPIVIFLPQKHYVNTSELPVELCIQEICARLCLAFRTFFSCSSTRLITRHTQSACSHNQTRVVGFNTAGDASRNLPERGAVLPTKNGKKQLKLQIEYAPLLCN